MATDTPLKRSRRSAKRGNGEGSVYFDERMKLWRATVQVGGGKRRYLSGKTRQEVAHRLVAAAREIQQGQLPPNQRLTLAQYLGQWMEQSAKPRLKASTFESYRHYIQKHIIPALGNRPVARLTAQEVQAFLNDKAASSLKPRTVQYLHGILRAALNRAVKWQVIPRNVALLVDPPRGGRPPISPLAPEEAAILLAAARGHCHEHLYGFMLASGVRVGEALALRWCDVDLNARRFRVEHTLERLNGRPWRLTEPKSQSGRRTVPLIGPAVVSLRSQHARIAQLRLAAGSAWQDLDFVFPSAVGTPLDVSNVYHQFKRLLAQAGLPSTHRPHDLRHSTATYLLAAGVPARVVMELLGHSQISLTLNTYSHVLPAMLDDAAARLESVFPAASRMP
jgi:integrase